MTSFNVSRKDIKNVSAPSFGTIETEDINVCGNVNTDDISEKTSSNGTRFNNKVGINTEAQNDGTFLSINDASGNAQLRLVNGNTTGVPSNFFDLRVDGSGDGHFSVSNNHVNVGTIRLPTSGGTASDLNFYEEFSGTASFSGPFSATPVITITRIGRLCNIIIGGIAGTSTTSSAFTSTATTIPSRFRPSVQIVQYANVTDLGALQRGLVVVNTSGVIVVYLNQALGAFSASGSAGFNNFTVTYSV